MFNTSGGRFPGKMDILSMDNKAKHGELSIDDYRDLSLTIGQSRYQVLAISEEFEPVLKEAIDYADKESSATTNNGKMLSTLLLNPSNWTQWQENTPNYIVTLKDILQ